MLGSVLTIGLELGLGLNRVLWYYFSKPNTMDVYGVPNFRVRKSSKSGMS